MNTSNKSDLVDLIIIGGGIAGSATAIACAAKGLRTLVIERDDERCGIESLSPTASKKLYASLDKIGAPLSEVIAWWGSAKETRLSCTGAHTVCRNQLSRQMRYNAMKQTPFLCLKSALSISRSNRKWRVRFVDINNQTRTFKADFLCDATGRRNVVGRALGSSRKNADRLCCITISTSAVCEAGIWTETVPNGWWNFCSDGKKGTLSFYSSADIIRVVNKDLMAYLKHTKNIRQIVQNYSVESKQVVLCGSSLLTPCAGPGWMAIGDAAMTFQPLTSAGVEKALRSAEMVLSVLDTDGEKYRRQCEYEFNDYLKQLSYQYSLEDRWANSDFWKPYQIEKFNNFKNPLSAIRKHHFGGDK